MCDGALGMPPGVAALGAVLCALLALSLELPPMLAAVGCLVLAVVVRAAVRRRRA